MPYLYFIIVDWSTFLVRRYCQVYQYYSLLTCICECVCVCFLAERDQTIRLKLCIVEKRKRIESLSFAHWKCVSSRMAKVRTFIRITQRQTHTRTHSHDFINPIDGTRNFAAFNKQAIKLTTTYIQGSLILFYFVLTFIQLHECKLVFPFLCLFVVFAFVFSFSVRACAYVGRWMFLRIRLELYLTLFGVLSKIICFLVQWGENNIDKRSIRIS